MLGSLKQRYADYFILISIFIFSRLIFLFFTPYGYYEEEGKIGSIGHDIIFERGLKLPFWGYLDSPHAGGSIFSGLAAIPFYLVFGDRYLALKMTALAFSSLTLALWYKLLLSETVSSRKTFIFSLLFFTFATPHYVQKSVILQGNTAELMFFNILVISYFWKIRSKSVFIPINYFFLGILCGFSFWIQFMGLYLFLTIILTLFITERFKTAIYQTFHLIIGFVFGALPLWIYNFQYSWATLTADARAQMYFSFNLRKLKHLLSFDMPASFHFLDIWGIKAQSLSFIVYGVFIIAVLIHLVRNLVGYILNKGSKFIGQKRIEISLEIFLILYIFVFILIASFSSFPVGVAGIHGWNSMNVHAEYYIVSLQLIIFALLILLNKYKNKTVFLMNILVSIIFILGYSGLFRLPYYNDSLLKPMHSTEANAYECGFNFVRNPELFSKFRKKVPSELQIDYIKGAKDFWETISQEHRKSILDGAEGLGINYREILSL